MKSANIKWVLLLFFTLLYSSGNDVIGQQYPDLNQAYFNPYLYNPATIGSQGYTELNMTYRKKLLGIDNAPNISVLNFQHSTNSTIDYGLMVMSDRSILLNKSTIMIGAAYKLLLSEASLVRFGLSIGYGYNILDLSQQDQTDLSIADASTQSSFATGQFGISFQQQDLEVGVSFPQIFRPKTFTENAFQPINFESFKRFKQFVVRVSYRINFGAGSVGLTPFAFYRQSQILPSIIKGGLIGDYKKQVKLGLGYNTNSSGIGYFGVEILNRVVLSCGYEFPFGGNAIDQNSYEVNLKYLLSSEKKNFSAKRSRRKKRQQSRNEDESEEFSPEEETSLPIEIGEDKQDSTLQDSGFIALPEGDETQPDSTEDLEIERVTEEETKRASNEIPFLEKGKFYVMVGVFRQKSNALNYVKSLNTKGWLVTVGRGLKKNLYYVYTLETLVKEEASKLKKELQRKGFGDSWMHVE